MKIKRHRRTRKRSKGYPFAVFYCVVDGDILHTDLKTFYSTSILKDVIKTGVYWVDSVPGTGKYLIRPMAPIVTSPDPPIGYMVGGCIWPIHDIHDVVAFRYKAVFHAC